MCAIAGAFNVPNASYVVQLMLKALQHRGQEAAGIAAAFDGKIQKHRAHGLVDEAFSGVDLNAKLPGRHAIGHTRYRTAGGGMEIENVQPMVARVRGSQVAIAHNGNLTDFESLRASFEDAGAVLRSTSDSELFLHLLAGESGTFDQRLYAAMQRPQGAWSLLTLTPDALYATTDPYGFRPLVMGTYQGGYVFASETCALDLLDAKPLRTFGRGEIVKVSDAGMRVTTLPNLPEFGRSCSFEHIYFSRPDSYAFGQSSGEVRERIGILMARRSPIDVDLITAVPDSSNAMAQSYAQELGIPFKPALIRNHYMGRTFITPHQQAREFGVRVKLNPAAYLVQGKRVGVFDDSVVRGTTLRKIAKALRGKGATEVHAVIGSPPIIHPCYYGIDTPSRQELFAANISLDRRAEDIGVNSLAHLHIDDLRTALEDPFQERYCNTCYTGTPPHEPFVPVGNLVRR